MFSRYAAPAKLPISVLFPNEGSHIPKDMFMTERGELGTLSIPVKGLERTTNRRENREEPSTDNRLCLIIGFAEQR